MACHKALVVASILSRPQG